MDETPANGEGQVAQVTPEISPENGQGEGVADTQVDPVAAKSFDEEYSEFLSKKGWKPEEGTQNLFKSYRELESHLGDWKTTKQHAEEFARIQPEYQAAQEKAAMWDRAQEYLEQMTTTEGLQAGTLDYSKVPTQTLADLFKEGKLSIADLPAERQYEVQRFVTAQDAAFEAQVQNTARTLSEKHPIVKDPEWGTLIADQIEKGVTENGRELSPEEIIVKFEKKLQEAERRGEERIKKDTEYLKNGDLERSGGAVSTTPKHKVSSVWEAFQAAKAEHGI